MNRRYLANVLRAAVVAVAAVSPALLRAQAPPGPITGVPPVSPSQTAGQSPAAVQPQPSKTIAGAWRLNRDESSLPLGGNSSGGGPRGGNGPYGGGGGSGPNGRRGGGTGFPFPGSGGNGPYGGGGRRNGGNDPNRGSQSPQTQQSMRPSASLTIEQKENEFDLIDDRQNRTALFTDGRKIQKPKNNDPVREVAAHWEGAQLITDEKTPLGDKLSRTFELSPSGLQLIETIYMENRRSTAPFTLRYVYDVSP